ncbi:DUF2306 domain-containing protein [Polaribacter sp. HL-MS24]|uniref:DUF2306 domain-containing protein n=1 Tax=Polaribacter sp. HL-MS24 TaxID=3077735 RepID=UPI0029348968|nr:DUF2306 domain-containing protein [Polaribacter sp. HL-MS24]WOC40036.1 DUF2306 domain-containing protein [Polaribacter sp. HL-MS24]
MLNTIIHSNMGLFHTLFAILAMVFGALVVQKKKGTTTHKRMGSIYVVCMLLLNITSFWIVNFGGFSLFHGLAIISLLTVLLAIIPTLLRVKKWMYFHFYYMNWSVVGLYCAFWAEIGTRFAKNSLQFWAAVCVAMLLTSIFGAILINKKAKQLKLK